MPTKTVTRVLTIMMRETCNVELPDDYAEYDIAELDDLVTDLYANVHATDIFLLAEGVLDATAWTVKEDE